MPKYLVVAMVDASTCEDVTANTPEEAAEKAHRRLHVSVCHQCSEKLTIGDIYRTQVVDDAGNGDVVYDTDPEPNAVHVYSCKDCPWMCATTIKLRPACTNVPEGEPFKLLPVGAAKRSGVPTACPLLVRPTITRYTEGNVSGTTVRSRLAPL